MWLTTRKKIENWYYWLVVDILATGIYIYKGIYFYALLYFIYVFLVASGLIAWRRSMKESQS
jgi:nicotinamide mononucleotide transporter